MLKRRTIITAIVAFTVILTSALSLKAQYNKDYFYWVGRNNMINNDYRGAIDVLNSLLRFDDNAYEAYFLRGIAKYNLNDLLGADADFSIAIEKNPVFTGAYVNRAITRSRLGNYDDALRDFEEAIELRPDMPNPYYSRGVTRLLNQQAEEAIKDFDEFIKYEKLVADAYVNRGICYLQLQDTLMAMENFDIAVRTNRESPTAYNRRGTIYLQQGKLEKAELDFDRSIANDSTYLLSFFNRSLVYNDTKRPLLALSDLDRVIELDSTNSLSFFNRAIVRSQVGDYNMALEDYNKVVDYSPNNVLAYFYRANLLTQLGEIESAEEDYTKAIELYPDFANAYLYRSDIRFMLNKSTAAKRDRNIAERKIAEHKSKLQDSTYSIYSDTTYRFDKLLSFDSNFSGSRFENLSLQGGKSNSLILIPLFRFTFNHLDSTSLPMVHGYHSEHMESFVESFNNNMLTLNEGKSNISPAELVEINKSYADKLRENPDSWEALFESAISQGLIKQYTNSVNTYSAAIKINPTNPFLYLNRSTTQAEMIDFISSIDNSYQRISIDSDPANQLNNNNQTRSYNYDEALSDLNKVIKLYPEFAYSYYNRANLLALSGRLPEAYDDYSKAIDIYPSFAEAYYNRGVIQIYMKDTRKGCIDISKAGELGITKAYEVLEEYIFHDN
ncbi:MAG: tetratricopeptide repeat protein [Rikenellaceae bacterium]